MAANKHEHQVPLWALFLALVALTAAEVGFYEIWVHSQRHAVEHGGEPFVPKVAMVLILLVVLTLPKALIVLVYFMHLKFEKQAISALAILPFIMALVVVLPMLTDARTLKPRAYNHPAQPIGVYHPDGEHKTPDTHGPEHDEYQ